MNKRDLIFAAAIFAGLQGCNQMAADSSATQSDAGESPTAENATADAETAAAQALNKCADVKTDGWKAVLDLQPKVGTGGPTLAISGVAHPTSGGWKLSLKEGTLDKKMPPIQRVEFIATRDVGIPEAPPPLPLALTLSKAQPKYDSVSIDCAGKQVASLDVEEVH